MLTHVQIHVTSATIRVQNGSITLQRLPHALSLSRALNSVPERNTEDQTQARFTFFSPSFQLLENVIYFWDLNRHFSVC